MAALKDLFLYALHSPSLPQSSPCRPCFATREEVFEQSTVEIWKTAVAPHLTGTLVMSRMLRPVQSVVHRSSDASLGIDFSLLWITIPSALST